MPCQNAISAAPAGTAAADDDLHGCRNLLEYLQGVPEPRRKCGIRHQLPVVLAFAGAAVLAGADSVTAISEWASDAPPEVLEALGVWRDRWRGRRVAPSQKTFRRVLARLEAQAVAARSARG